MFLQQQHLLEVEIMKKQKWKKSVIIKYQWTQTNVIKNVVDVRKVLM